MLRSEDFASNGAATRSYLHPALHAPEPKDVSERPRPRRRAISVGGQPLITIATGQLILTMKFYKSTASTKDRLCARLLHWNRPTTYVLVAHRMNWLGGLSQG